MLRLKRLFVLAMALVAVGLFMTACVEEDEKFHGDTYIRFAWEKEWQPNISYIFASEQDIRWWYDEIYSDLDIGDDDFVARPSFKPGTPGLPGLPQNARPLLGLWEAATFVSPNNGREFKIDEDGTFIAVCSVDDPEHTYPGTDVPVIWEIVVDYAIKADYAVNPEDIFFELGFWLTDFFEDADNWGWYGWEYEDGESPRLSKRGGKGRGRRDIGITAPETIELPGSKVTVTYYAFPRARKN
jgi:hypothetical protein